MSEAVIVALITAGLSLCGTVITVITANRQTLAALDKKSELSDEKIQGEINIIKNDIKTLSAKVDEHNKLIDRTYRLETAVDVHEEKIKVANNRIADLERKGA